jgi:peptidoglycan/LPS O-acetylase OafA/YrhL
MPDRQGRSVVALVTGFARAPGFRLRSLLLVSCLLSLGFAAWSATRTDMRGVLGGSAGFAVLLVLGVVAQYVAERSGAVERDRRRDEDLRAEMADWPRWKRIAFLVVGVVVGVVMLLLRIWSDGFRPG